MNALEERAVVPSYLQMMGLNAVRTDPDMTNGSDLLPELVRVGVELDAYDVKRLLNVGAWRPVVMGAWFSLRFSAAEIGLELRRAMQRSAGSLTARRPLATACVIVTGKESIPDLEHYMRADPRQDGSADFVAAAIDHLVAEQPRNADGMDAVRLREMVEFAERLRRGFEAGV